MQKLMNEYESFSVRVHDHIVLYHQQQLLLHDTVRMSWNAGFASWGIFFFLRLIYITTAGVKCLCCRLTVKYRNTYLMIV